MSPVTTSPTRVPEPQGTSNPPSSSRRIQAPPSDAWLYATLAVLLAAAWQVSHMGLYSAGSDVGYWIGVAGGTAMLLLFAYPLRKRSAWLSRWGKAKHWFAVHMVLGVLGPVLVLAHSAFRIGSMNAGVALVSMLVVAASGVVGRFIYLRTHHGLGGEQQSFQALQRSLGLSDESTRSALHFAPAAEQRLLALRRHTGTPGDGWAEHGRRLVGLPWRLRLERRAIRREALCRLREIAAEQRWDSATRRAREHRVSGLIAEYAGAVQRLAQLAAYTRLFSLWHVLHVPFVFLMVICAVVHVVAVHAY